ncbi:MAG: tyrosine-type recombinase/integrase [Firmicutes bacterium]|nr:tyrosine-type recombinase/integrase [Bacillota bacterium]
MDDKNLIIHNKTDKPDNVVERENQVLELCEELQSQLPSWMRGYFLFLRNSVLPMTRLAYLGDVKFFCNYLIHETDLTRAEDPKAIKLEEFQQIQAVDINLFLDYSRRYKVEDEKGVTVYENRNSALSRKKSSVSVLFKYLYRDGLVPKNITDGFDPIKLSKPGEREIKALKEDEVMKMLDAVTTGEGLTKKELENWKKTKLRDKLILLTFVTYGLRLSELQQLNVSSFNFERGEFKIYRKRGKESLMPINRTITDAFSEYVQLERPSDDRLSDENKDALFLSQKGTRLTDRQLREIVKKYTSISLGTSRKKGYSPHKLRATAATSLIARGNDIFDVQQLLDHDNVTTTQLYAGHRLNSKRDLIKGFEWDEDMLDGSDVSDPGHL